MSNRSSRQRGEVLRLRNLAMIENIRRAEDPTWRDRLEQQQVVARLGRRFSREASPLEAMREHAHALKDELRAAPAPWRPCTKRGERDG